jgi:hypothetical protein
MSAKLHDRNSFAKLAAFQFSLLLKPTLGPATENKVERHSLLMSPCRSQKSDYPFSLNVMANSCCFIMEHRKLKSSVAPYCSASSITTNCIFKIGSNTYCEAYYIIDGFIKCNITTFKYVKEKMRGCRLVYAALGFFSSGILGL